MQAAWAEPSSSEGEDDLADLLNGREIDRFDRVQLADVIRVCREASSLAEAGRILFSSSRHQTKTVNDSDRVRKYLARFGLDWTRVKQRSSDCLST